MCYKIQFILPQKSGVRDVSPGEGGRECRRWGGTLPVVALVWGDSLSPVSKRYNYCSISWMSFFKVDWKIIITGYFRFFQPPTIFNYSIKVLAEAQIRLKGSHHPLALSDSPTS